MTEEKHTRFELIYTDPETNIVERRVIAFPSEEYNEATIKIFDPSNNGAYTGHFVDNSTPLGESLRGKIFHYRSTPTRYQDETINYEVKDDVIRFRDFHGIVADGYHIGVRKDESGDLLEVDLKKSKFAPTDGKEVNRIRYVLWAVQRFNNELLEEVGTEDDGQEESESTKDVKEQSGEVNAHNNEHSDSKNSNNNNDHQHGQNKFGQKPNLL